MLMTMLQNVAFTELKVACEVYWQLNIKHDK